ncbi:MAG: NAD(P)H-hydrate dehydratase [Micavibrio sp.]|nr:NAD(P)H-hydrate dehydratase [Micavibrio sp.]
MNNTPNTINAVFGNDRAILTSRQMQETDEAAIASGIKGFDLMQTAGGAVAAAISERWPPQPVIVLCGPGNNGGDGFVTASRLKVAGWPVRLASLVSRDRLVGDAASAATLWKDPIELFTPKCLDNSGIAVDAMFGAGLSRPLTGPALEMVDALKARGLPICAIDVPSGVDGSTGQVLGGAAAAELTVTFFRKKPGHLLYPGRALCGDVVVSDIGIPASILRPDSVTTWENGASLWLQDFPWPKPDSNKYTRGEVLILGGEVMTGASRMAAFAASRAGAGMVTLAAPSSVWNVYASSLLNVVVHRFDGSAEFIALLTDIRRNAIAIGPGAGVDASTRECVLAALATRRAVVLDADALSIFAEMPQQLFDAIDGPCVLTPHAGEFKRLFQVEGDKLQSARKAAWKCGGVIVLKGPDTVIAAPDGRAIINTNGPPQLATAGSGDVLTGFVVALLAQGMPAFEAAASAVWLHGAAAAAFGPGLVAQDLPDALPSVLQRLRPSV